MNTSIISVYNANLLSENLVPSFATICKGDILIFTDKVVVEQFPDHHTENFRTIEMLVFRTQRGEYVKLPMSKILKSRGEVGSNLQFDIWNGDLKTGKDFVEALRRNPIRVREVGYDTITMLSRESIRKLVYTFDWVN